MRATILNVSVMHMAYARHEGETRLFSRTALCTSHLVHVNVEYLRLAKGMAALSMVPIAEGPHAPHIRLGD